MTEQVTLQQRRKTLRQFREEAGLSLEDLGKACGLSRSTLSRFENGERDLSEDAYNRVLEAIEKFLTKKRKALRLEEAKRESERVELERNAVKLGASVPYGSQKIRE